MSAGFNHPLTHGYSTQSQHTGRLFSIACAVFVCVIGLVQAQDQGTQTGAPQGPDPNAPWPEAERKGLRPKRTGPAAPPSSAPKTLSTTPTAPESQPPKPAPEMLSAPAPVLQPPKVTKHEISASADFLLGEGTVTVPAGFSLAQAGGFGAQPIVNDADRESTYFGATLSYSFGQAWYFDFGYANGSSSGSIDYDAGGGVSVPSDFTLDDDWYQAYVRYTFPQLRGKRLSAYLRAGVSYVQADLTVESVFPGQGLYEQTDETTDLLGNLGFGVAYSVYSGRRLRIGLQMEGEGFYGTRSQDSAEALPQAGISFPSASIDNTLYGGIGRATVRLEYRLGQSGLFKIFLDAGGQLKYTIINYDSTGSFSEDSFDETLWGPYVKIGLRYAF